MSMKTQLSLFAEQPISKTAPLEAPSLPEVEPPALFYPNFMGKKDREEAFALSQRLDWQRNKITMRGMTMPVPRDEAIYGEEGLSYKYRDITLTAKPWPHFLKAIRDQIEELSGYKFPFAIGNRYNSGKDSIGYHSDDSPEIGPRPAIASLSLGGTRKFKLRHKESGNTFDYWLEAGSLLIMLPGCQEDWVHAIPKTARFNEPRINWTFRPHVEAQ